MTRACVPPLERFGDCALADIKTADVEDFIADLRKPRIVGREPVPRSITGGIGEPHRGTAAAHDELGGRPRARHRTPFRRGSETLIKRLHEDNQRRRRITDEEEARLLAAAPVHFRAMIIAALDTGLRRGESWPSFGDIDWDHDLIASGARRPRAASRASSPSRPSAFAPSWRGCASTPTANRRPTRRSCSATRWRPPAPLARHLAPHGAQGVRCQADVERAAQLPRTLRRIESGGPPHPLRWHDIRHEYASRLVEQGVPLAQVRDLLGHASITTTERYDNQKLENLQVAVTKLERGLAFSAEAASWTPAEPPGGRLEAASARQPVTGPAVAQRSPSPAHLAGDDLSSFFQELGSDAPIEALGQGSRRRG